MRDTKKVQKQNCSFRKFLQKVLFFKESNFFFEKKGHHNFQLFNVCCVFKTIRNLLSKSNRIGSLYFHDFGEYQMKKFSRFARTFSSRSVLCTS